MNNELKKNELSIQALLLQLQAQRDEILSNGKTIRVDFSVDQNEILDEVDMALADTERGMKMRLGNRESLYFRKVEEALLRIKDGTYGQCLGCGGEISVKRLEARPTAELCIECKEAAERSEALNAEGRRHKSLGDAVDFKV
ncbi:MAG: TraR/DksA family transcriptional regulator [Bacteriovoracia bacterium]